MGIFVDKCQALIDPATGRALTGEALEKAKLDKKAPRCGNKVRKAAKFCNKCGSGAPGGWVKCYNCHKWIGNDSKFCPHCDAPLYPEERAGMAGGVWGKTSDLFAQRFEIGDIKRLLKHDLHIQAGTVAILLDGGKFKGIVDSGTYNPDSLARKINNFGAPPPRSVIVLDAGDIVLPVSVKGLRSSEQFDVDFYGEVMIRFGNDKKSAEKLLENLLKEQRALTYADLTDALFQDVRNAVDAMCVKSTMEDLVRDPERRIRLKEEIRAQVAVRLESCGLELIHVSSAEFYGERFEELASQMGDVETQRREKEYDAALRDVLTKDRMSKFKSEADVAEYEAALSHEYGLSEEKRKREKELLLTRWKQEDVQTQLKANLENAKIEIEHSTLVNDHKRDEKTKDAATEAKVRNIAFEQEKTEVDTALEWRRQKEAIKMETRKQAADLRSNMSNIELLADEEDPEKRKSILQAIKLTAQDGKTPEQILAMAAESSPAAAEALAKMKNNRADDYERLMKEMKELYKDASDRVDSNLKVTVERAIGE